MRVASRRTVPPQAACSATSPRCFPFDRFSYRTLLALAAILWLFPEIAIAQTQRLEVLPVGTLNLIEGETATFAIRLPSQPAATVTVAITQSDVIPFVTPVTLDKTSLTFTRSDWNIWQVVTASLPNDNRMESLSLAVLDVTPTGNYNPITVDLFLWDSASPGLSLHPSTQVVVRQGRSAEQQVRLVSQPTATVTVTVTTPGIGVTTDKTRLTFTTSDWNLLQTVTVSAAADAPIGGFSNIVYTFSGGNYGPSTFFGIVSVVADSVPAALLLSPSSLRVVEGGDASYTVRLSAPPSGSVTVAANLPSGTDLTLDAASLTFTTSTWNTAQTVTVSAAEDDDAVNDVATLLHTASGGGYDLVAANLQVAVIDDDATSRRLVISPPTLRVAEGGSNTYTVRLATQPTAQVTVAIAGQASTDLSLDSTSLTFTTSTWNTAQTVTVSASQDDDAVNDSATLTHTAAGGDYGTVAGSVAVTVTDDDAMSRSLMVSPSSLAVAEGGSNTYTVRLATQPTAQVTVAIAGQASTDLSLDSTSLTFTTSTWSTAQTVTVSAAEDIDAANDAATLLHTASGGDYAGETAEVAVTVTDDDTPGTVVLSPTALGVAEGADAEYTVRLSSQPTAEVTVAVTGQASTDLTLDTASLTFTTVTWNTVQTVTVSAAEDDDAVNDAATLLHTASGGNYGSVTGSLGVTVTDDDTAALTLSTATLGVTEGDDAEYTVRLATQPTATVTVAISGTASTDLSLDSTSLTFTTSTWSTAQTVTVSAAEDIDAANDAATLLHTASGGDYAGETAEVAVTVTDDDTPGTVVLSPTALVVAEGADAEYTVRLSSQPTAEVTVAVTGQASTDLTLDATSLTFTTVTWNTAQTVTVSAAQDDDAVNDAATLLHTASGANYGSVTGSLGVTVTDDDTAALTLSTATLGVTEGADAEYTVRLATQPTATVTVAITGQASTDLSLDSTSLTFTTSTWNTAQTVTVSAAEDIDAANDAATLLHTASGGDYAGETAEVAVTVTDDDRPGTVVLSPTALGVAEGADAEYTVRLSSQPTAEVTVAVTGQASTDLTLDTASLTFTTSTWNTVQTVTVSAAEDDDAVNDAATLLHTASGGNYGSVTGSLGVTVTDDDTAALTLSTATLGVTEGDDAEYTVRLATQPTSTVTVAISGTASTDLSLDSTSLTFTTSTWNTAQTVTVSAAEDIDAANDAATLLHTASGGDYAGETAEVAVTVTDDDTPGTVVLSPTALGVAEGADAEYTVRLSSQPTAEVTVAVSGTASTDLTLDSTSLTFTTSTWNAVQTVTVSAAEDDDAVNDAATLLHTASGGNYGSVTGSLGVTVTDDDTAALTLSTATLGVGEGDDAEYTVRLATQPTATVTVAITGTTSTDLSLDSTSLTFTTSTWSTAQTVTVSAAEDIDAANDAATLLHTASGGDYAGETAEVAVTVTDDDTPGTVVLSPTALGVAEGADAEYTVRLSSQPTAEVTVAVTGQASTDLTLDATSLTFTTVTWNTAQTVTVSAAQDDDAVNDAATLTHTASGGNYGSVTGSLGVTVTDDDTAALTLSTATLGVIEGADAEYTVRLATQPTATVTVAITGQASTDLSLDSTSLTFTTSTWNTVQTVTVSAAEDIDVENDAATLLHTASGGDYAGETAEVAVTVTDDDTPGTVVLSPTALGVAEGADAEYTVRLSSQPTAEVTVAVTGQASTDLTLDTASLTFTTVTWNTAQTVTVSAAQDDDAVNDAATLLHTASGANYGSVTGSLGVTVTDDDTAALTLSTATLGVTEGDDAEYTVRLATQPTATVTVAITGQASTDLTLSAASLTFTTSTWNTVQTVTVSAAEDIDAANDAATLLHTASGGDYAGETAEVAVTVTDDDRPGTVVLSPTALGVAEGADAEYTVRLSSQPTAEVTVAVTGQASTDLTLDTASLTFTTSTWNTVQTVTVSAAEDDDAVNDAATLLHTASGGNYGSVTGSLGVTVTDDDTAALTLSTATLGVTEGDDAEYTVRLATQPTATVTVAISGTASTDLSLDSTSLTFTTATWNTVQTVTVTAGEDDDAANDAATLLHTASGGDYASETASVAVTVTDNESVGLTLSTTALGIAEGDDAEYTVRLATQPTATVTVAITGTASTDLTLDSTSLTFTTATWNTAQTVTVTAGEDDDAANDAATLLHTASGGDYAGETAEVAVTVTDDESVGIVLSPPALGVAEGDDAEYTVRLATQPSATVTVAVTGQADTDLSLDSTSLTFTTSTWNTAQTVTVSAGEDDDADNDTATLLHTASGGDYAGETAEVAVTVTDDESVGIVLSPPALGVAEGDDAEYTVRLATQPSATVTVAVTGQADTDLTLDATSLTFTTSTWNTAQTVTVSAGEDDDADNDTATLLHTASGGDYAGETAEVAVTVTDDESVGIVLSPPALGVAEGDDAEYTVRLATQPSATVTVAVTGQADTDLTLDATSLTFTTSTWNTAQTVTVSAGEDDDADNDTATLLHTASGGDYAGETAEVAVTVTDDESVGIVLSPPALGVAEGDDAEYTVRLATQPSATVTVAVTGQADTDLTLDATSLTFTTSTWNTAQTVTVSAGEDDDADNDTATLLHTASGGDYAGETAEVAVTVTDDETPETAGLVLSPSSLSVPEGSDAEYAVRLATQPSANVTVAISGHSGTDLTLDTASLTFTTSTWNTAQTVTVTAEQDDDAEDDEATLAHAAAGGGYGSVTADLAVTVEDDDGEPVSGEVVLSVSPSSVSEGDGTTSVTVTATLSAGARGEATVVTVTVAEDADDYAATPAGFEIEIPEDATSAAGAFDLTPVDDADDEPDQRVAITGTTEVGLAVQGTSVTIRDDDEPNRSPTFPETSYTFDLPENVSGRDTAVALGTVAASDADGDRLRYALSAGDGDRFTVSRGGEVSYVGAGEDFESGPSQFDLQVTAGDGQYEAQAQVTVRVVDAPESPEAKDDRAETPEDTPLVIDVLSNDTDPDGERLRVASVTAPENGTAAVVSGGVRYEPDLNWYGEDRFTYTAMDPGGLRSEATVRVTVTPVNDPPEAVDDEAETLEDVAVVVDVLANDTDVDGDPLTVISAGPAGHGATAIADGGVRYSPALNWYGTDRFSYTIADPGGLTATATVTMTVLPVNDAPEAVGVIPDQTLEEGGGAVTVDLTPYFTDVDGDALSYAAVSSDESAVTVAVAGATLTLSPFVTGTATVTVTAADPDGLTATQTFGVLVGDLLVREVLTDALAALGRAHLSSARTAIGRRLAYDDGATQLLIAGQQLTPEAWEQMGVGGLEQSHWLSFRAATLRHRRSSLDMLGTSADPRFERSGLMGGGFGGAGTDWGRILQGTDVLLSFGGQDDTETSGTGVGRWRVWGQGDRQSFQWAPDDAAGYEGDLTTGYLGVDAQLSEHLLAGLAVSRSGSGSDWRQGYSSGRLGTELTVLHPYVRVGGRDTAVWALAGVGRGTADNVRALNGRRGTSPLDLRLGLLEGRHRLGATAGGVELALRGEASWARLRTGSGEETVDALKAAVRRLRTGVEAALPLGGPGGMQFAPFGAVSTRHDGGAGQTGLGLETAAGVRISGGRVRIEAQGRRLLLHTAAGYEEHGFSVTAMVGGGHYEPGLTASVRPHWGAPGYGAESLWQDHVQSYTAGSDRSDGGVDARVGYGVRLPGGRLLTPLVGYGQVRDSRRVQVGARIGVLGRFNGDLSTPVEVEFLGERYARPAGADHRVGLYGIVNFGAPSASRATSVTPPVAEVVERRPTAAEAVGRRPRPRPVAVEPLVNLSADPADDWVGRGVAESVAVGLEGFGVRVLRTAPSAESGRGLGGRLRQPVAGDAGLRVNGEYERFGDRLRLSARLSDTRTRTVVEEIADVAWNDLFALQDRITEALVAALVAPAGQ